MPSGHVGEAHEITTGSGVSRSGSSASTGCARKHPFEKTGGR